MKNKRFIIILLMITLLSVKVKAQLLDPNLKKFSESIIINFNYPEQLRQNCIPTTALIKVVIDNIGTITNMDVSDSADMLFKINFQSSRSKFDIKSLKLFLDKYHLKKTTILIPYFIHLSSKNCPTALSGGDLSKYQIFSSIPLEGDRIYTDPIIAIEKDEYDIK